MSTQNLVLRTVYISPDVDDKLRTQAFDKRTSKNDLIRQYIELGMQAAAQSKVVTPVQAAAKKRIAGKVATTKAASKPRSKTVKAKPVTA